MVTEPIHIVLICSSLNMPGGIERAIVNTGNLFRSKGHNISVVILAETGQSFYPIDPLISVRFTPLHFGITERGTTLSKKIQLLHHLKKLSTILKKLNADIIITTEYQFTIAACLALKSKKVISWEHHHYFHLIKSKFWQALYNKIYPRIQRVVALNSSEQEFYTGIGCTTSVIPNFVSPPAFPPQAVENKVLLTIGWLTITKGMDVIPAIAQIVFQKHPDWKWKIIGMGPEKDTLARELEFRSLSDHVQIIEPGSPDLSTEYNKASIYVMLSKFECFPMVLLEAMSYGVPSIAFDCPTGPKHIINNGEDGMLVQLGNIEAIAAAIFELIENEERRKLLGTNAAENMQRFAPETIYALWENVLYAG